MDPEVKTFASVVELKPSPPGKFKALVSQFDVVDKGGDVVKRGAFAASLREWRASGGKIPVIYSHQWEDPSATIGEVSPHDTQETDRGLIASGMFYLDEELGAKVYKNLRRGVLREWSFSALVKASRPRPDGGRELTALHLVEIGPCLVGKGETQTLEVASVDRPSAAALTVAQRLAPFRARLAVAQARVARR